MAAATSAQAIKLLERNFFDGLVAAARLPDTSGVELLNTVSRRFPAVVRLIRDGPDDKLLLRGFLGWPPCHLTQAMDLADVEAGLEGAFQIAEWTERPAIKGLLPQMLRLPTPPELYTRLMNWLASPNYSTQDVAELIAKDPALTPAPGRSG